MLHAGGFDALASMDVAATGCGHVVVGVGARVLGMRCLWEQEQSSTTGAAVKTLVVFGLRGDQFFINVKDFEE